MVNGTCAPLLPTANCRQGLCEARTGGAKESDWHKMRSGNLCDGFQTDARDQCWLKVGFRVGFR